MSGDPYIDILRFVAQGSWRAISAATLVFLLSAAAFSQQPSPDELTATPNRPTITNTAETTQYGVLEIEYGISAAAQQQSMQGLLKFGLLKDVELDWAGNPWQHDASVHFTGVGDNYPGVRWRFLHQGKRQPTLTAVYSAKLPTAGPVEGTGETDHIVTLLASKDLPAHLHLDANLDVAWLGRPGGGFDRNWLPTFSLNYAFTDKFGISVEFSGATRANASTPAITQNLWALNYNVRPRLVLDSAVQFRVIGNVPRVVFLGGFTYSIADLYHHRF